MQADKKLKVSNFVWLAVSLLLFLGLLGVSFYKQSRSTRALTATWEVKNVITDLVSSVKDAETGQRGYVITSETDYLAPYHTALSNYEPTLEKLKELTIDDSFDEENVKFHQDRIFKIDSLIQLKFAELKENIDRTEKGQKNTVVRDIKTDVGKRYMDKIRLLGAEMYEYEKEQLQNRIQNFKSWRSVSIVLAIIAALIVVYCLLKIYREVYPVFTEINETRKELHNTTANLAETVSKLKHSENEMEAQLQEKEKQIEVQAQEIEQLKKTLSKFDNKA